MPPRRSSRISNLRTKPYPKSPCPVPLPSPLLARICEILYHDDNDITTLLNIQCISELGRKLSTPFIYRRVHLKTDMDMMRFFWVYLDIIIMRDTHSGQLDNGTERVVKRKLSSMGELDDYPLLEYGSTRHLDRPITRHRIDRYESYRYIRELQIDVTPEPFTLFPTLNGDVATLPWEDCLLSGVTDLRINLTDTSRVTDYPISAFFTFLNQTTSPKKVCVSWKTNKQKRPTERFGIPDQPFVSALMDLTTGWTSSTSISIHPPANGSYMPITGEGSMAIYLGTIRDADFDDILRRIIRIEHGFTVFQPPQPAPRRKITLNFHAKAFPKRNPWAAAKPCM